jgi:hypothetical protein
MVALTTKISSPTFRWVATMKWGDPRKPAKTSLTKFSLIMALWNQGAAE